MNIDAEEKTAELQLHKTRVKKFYQILGDSATNNEVLQIAFDMQQIQQLPKTNIGETYYLHQFGVYNLTIVIRTAKKIYLKNVFIYTLLESDTGKSSNQVASVLHCF